MAHNHDNARVGVWPRNQGPLVYGYDVRLSSEWSEFESRMDRHLEAAMIEQELRLIVFLLIYIAAILTFILAGNGKK